MSLLALILCPDTRSSGLTLTRNSLATRHHLIPGWQSRAMAGDNDLISSVNTQICNWCNARTARFTRMAVLASNKVVRSIFPIVITDMRGGGMSPLAPGLNVWPFLALWHCEGSSLIMSCPQLPRILAKCRHQCDHCIKRSRDITAASQLNSCSPSNVSSGKTFAFTYSF